MATSDALVSAKSLLELAEFAGDEVQVSSAASSAVVAAIAHLARATDVALLSSVANREASEGGSTPLHSLERRLPVSLRGRVQQLTVEVLGKDVTFDDRRPMAGVLTRAISLRNKLIHHGGFVRMGNPHALGGKVRDGRLWFGVELPRLEWREVTLEYAREVVEAVEEFLDNALVEPQEGVPLDRRFFSSLKARKAAEGRPQSHPANRS